MNWAELLYRHHTVSWLRVLFRKHAKRLFVHCSCTIWWGHVGSAYSEIWDVLSSTRTHHQFTVSTCVTLPLWPLSYDKRLICLVWNCDVQNVRNALCWWNKPFVIYYRDFRGLKAWITFKSISNYLSESSEFSHHYITVCKTTTVCEVSSGSGTDRKWSETGVRFSQSPLKVSLHLHMTQERRLLQLSR